MPKLGRSRSEMESVACPAAGTSQIGRTLTFRPRLLPPPASLPLQRLRAAASPDILDLGRCSCNAGELVSDSRTSRTAARLALIRCVFSSLVREPRSRACLNSGSWIFLSVPREGVGHRLGSEIDLGRGNPCSLGWISLLLSAGNTRLRTPELGSSRCTSPAWEGCHRISLYFPCGSGIWLERRLRPGLPAPP